ncbi:DUF3995 domain-containing protein [Micromonospora sp. ALFpr18c]|uniref:DUF3995 domain-containing protein n=1 Tax=unclassified Micromonospora TaxID=2617518 RepID=UPI00124B2A55|nr:DUF3995 domain-containing protein [Micromonospora sp. ALFpr18c]KAB1946340.1 DUF3995 domain-containing protein [Micromonospora sp. ALFpr18c]
MPVSRSPRWAYGALAWLILFTASHVVLVLVAGDDPTGDGPWGRRAYLIFNVVLIVMSTVGAAVVAATVRPWARQLPRWLILIPLWFGSILLVLRGVPGMVENVLMVTGNRRGGFVGAQDISTGEFWAGIGINTYFFLGAVLLVAATVSHTRRSSKSRRDGPSDRSE